MPRRNHPRSSTIRKEICYACDGSGQIRLFPSGCVMCAACVGVGAVRVRRR